MLFPRRPSLPPSSFSTFSALAVPSSSTSPTRSSLSSPVADTAQSARLRNARSVPSLTMSSDQTAGPAQAESFVAPEGEYHYAPGLFTGQQMPLVNAGAPAPVLPVKLSTVTVYYPPQRTGMPGLGSLLGMGGGGNGNGQTQPAPPAKDSLSLSPLLTTNTNGQPNFPPSPNSPGGNMPYEPSLSSSVSEDPPSSDAATQSPLPVPSDLSQSFASSRFLGGSSNRPPAPPPHPRPKNNIKSTSSSFVTRIQSMEGLNKVLSERAKGGEEARWAFWNLGRILGWVECGGKAKEPLARITFSVAITCHCVQPLTATPERLDVLIGFVTGDLVWFDPLAGRYTRFNKAGLIHPSPVLSIIAHPTNALLFYALHQDGHVITYSLDRDDPHATFVPPWLTSFASPTATPSLDGSAGDNLATAGMSIWRNPPAREGDNKDKERSKLAGKNPIAVWKLNVGTGGNPASMMDRKRSTTEKPATGTGTTSQAHSMNGADGGKGLTGGRISPDGRMMGLTGDDGGLRIIDLPGERLVDHYTSYFGGLTSLAWSPDSRFLLFAGQDDLITILSPRDQRIVARCQGHTSFVTSVAWDRERSDPAKGRYRFGSVGEDGKVLLWDFSPASLQRPRGHHSSTSGVNRRTSISSTTSFGHQLRRQSLTISSSNLPLFIPGSTTGTRFHPAPPRAEVALLQAVMTKTTDPSILTDIFFTGDAICTVSRFAQVRFWSRPATKTKSGQFPLPDARGNGLGIRRGPKAVGVVA